MVNAIQAEIDRDEELEQNHQTEVNNKVAELEGQYRERGFYNFQFFCLLEAFVKKPRKKVN